MYYDQSWGIAGVKAINKDAETYTKSAVPLKGGSGDGASILSAAVLILADNGDARKEAVKELIEYILRDEVLGDYLANIVPAYPAMKSMSQPDNAVLTGAADSISTAVASPSIPQLNDLNLELDTLAQAVTVSDEDVDKAIEEFRASAKTLLQ
jgi:multiple sugar transport system substrate-binding protein